MLTVGGEEFVLQFRVHSIACFTVGLTITAKPLSNQKRRNDTGICLQKFFILFFMLLTSVVHAQQQENKMELLKQQKLLSHPQQIPALVKGKKIAVEQIPNPHWRADGCLACHKKRPKKNNLHLRHNNTDQTCNTCHTLVSSHDYIHPSNVDPDKTMLKNMAKGFRKAVKQSKGKVVCTTCHDLPMQCKTDRFKERGLNPLFLRKGPYKARSSICYQCHDVSAYQRLNPHDQISDQGKLRKDRCSLCHQTLNKLKKARTIKDVDFNVTGDLSMMCTGCHPWRPHPGGASLFARKKKVGLNHLVKPPKEIAQQIQKTTRDKKIILPLDPNTGRIFCGTCHNPHEKKVIKTAAAARGADSKNRLRMKRICEGCHDK